MNKITTLTLACAAALLLGSTAWATPYDVAYGIQWTDQKGGDSNRLDGRGGSVEIDPNTGKVIVGVESQDATFGPVMGGLSIQSGSGVYSKTGVFEFGYMATMDSLDSDSQHYGNSIDIDSSGNVYQGGNTRHEWPGAGVPTANSAGYVQKRTIADGTLQWTTLVDLQGAGADWQPGTGVAVDSTGATWLTGYANGELLSAGHPGNYVGTPAAGNPYDPYLVKINADGTFADIGIQQGGAVQGDGTAANDRAYGVAIDPNNDNIVAMTGWSSGVAAGSPGMFAGTTYDGGSRDGFLAVYDATGKTAGQAPDLVFGKMLNSGDATGRDAFYSVAFAPDGDIVVGGYKDGDLATGHQIYVEKYDVDGSSGTVGALVWSDTFGDASGAVDLLIYEGVKFDGDGNMYVMAYTNGDIEGTNAGGNDIVVRKYDSSLNAVWTNQIGQSGNDVMNGAVVSDDKTEIYIAAATATNWPDGAATLSGGTEALLIKMTPGDFDGDDYVDHDDQNALGIAVRDSNNAFGGDFVADGVINRDDLDFFIHEVFDTFYGDYALSGAWDPGDADGATRPIFAGGGYNAISDLDNDFDTDADDLTAILTQASIARGDGPTPYKAGDTDWDKDVDITDFNILASNFDPGGANGPAVNTWANGDYNGSMTIDISDFNTLATNFAPGGYDGAAAAVAADADPGQIDLIVDLATGEVLLDGNGAQASGIQVFSPSGSLLAADMTPALLQFVISTNATTYAEGAFANVGVNGLVSLGTLFDLAKGVQDLTFEYTALGQQTATGRVIFIPEPASLVLMGLGGLLVLRRRRAA